MIKYNCSGLVFPQIYIYSEPQNMILFRNKVFADAISHFKFFISEIHNIFVKWVGSSCLIKWETDVLGSSPSFPKSVFCL